MEQLSFSQDVIERRVAPGKTDTSRAAAQKIQPSAQVIRDRALAAITRAGAEGATTSEIARRMRVDILSVRPRVTELKDDGHAADSGVRRENANGNPEIVWVLPTFKVTQQ